MNKQNNPKKLKCTYCSNQPTGIIYRPKQLLDNVLVCTSHATNLFIPFKDTQYDKNSLADSRYRSPIKKFQHLSSSMAKVTPLQINPQIFLDKLMENIIEEFNSMKKLIISSYHKMKNLQKNQDALKFRVQGDSSLPYMIINNDQDMMMSTFVNRLVNKHNQDVQRKKRQQIAKRRLELSAKIQIENNRLNSGKSVQGKSEDGVFFSRSINCSPTRSTEQFSLDMAPRYVERKPLIPRASCQTQRIQKK